ncbi:MAG: hypothetical protein V4819_16375, partial [Verrucomicrobiota bacterium]
MNEPKPAPNRDSEDFLTALQSREPDALSRYFASISPGFKDEPLPVLGVPQSEWISGQKVPIPDAIARYLASGDTLSDHTINMMECAMETAYQVAEPWFITS